MKKIFLATCNLIVHFQVFSQENRTVINQILAEPVQANIGETIIKTGESFIGKPYEGGTLEGPEEKLVCKLDGFDCYTFVENVLAISLTKYSSHKTHETYLKYMQNLRYRNGKINGFGSRIHYFSDWVKHAEARKILQDLTPAVGVKNVKEINFMTQNRNKYPSMASDETVYNQIANTETNLNKHQLYIIKKADFKTYQPMIKNGDIVAFTSSVNGLDVNHEGFAVWKGNKLHFLHASIEKKKVLVSDETILEYLQRIKKHSGIMLIRVNQPKS